MSPICDTKRDLRSCLDLGREDMLEILSLATELKTALKAGRQSDLLAGKALAMLFEKPSLRTRATFELGMKQLGGHALYFAPHEIGIGVRESVEDVARNLERWFDFVMARTFAQATVDGLCRHCHVPVVNGLSDMDHPCQALADFLTLQEKFGALDGLRLTYVGDGNNICHALMVAGVKLGLHVTVSSPGGFEPKPEFVEAAGAVAAHTGGSYRFAADPREAVKDAQAIYTDVWASMGQEDEAEERAEVFEPWQVNRDLVAAAPSGALIMHDLPAHRGEEITGEVIDGPHSIVFDQAENRLHAQKGVLAFLHYACQGE